ncbi:PHP domain-containing protein [Candidatus Aerophobetes bacterium]|uniref:PHP domain-containing protein n=1 Tax=Aerophobetes bacterium TaxID=2030807 RepID=A0A523QHG8_UNCAE|nr:MAG: PHP domain-containing protein [Candidatus Aerophobetes bacterium]
MLRWFRADLHLHTCLSPCADSTMSPMAIVKEAKKRKLQIVGICDHNSVENVEAVRKAGKRERLAVMGGIEITSREEVHILGFFSKKTALWNIQDMVYKKLSGENDENLFGEQIVADEYDRVIGSNKRLLIGASRLSVEEIVDAIHGLGGLAIASHIDRQSFSIIGQLGFVPRGLTLDALEISPLASREKRCSFSQEYDLPLVTFSDAHCLDDIRRSFSSFLMGGVSVEEIKKALMGKDGRKVIME